MVEDDVDDALLLVRALQSAGWTLLTDRVDSAGSMVAALERVAWDVVISDCALPGFSCVEALKLARIRRPNAAFIVVSGTIGEEAAAALMKEGAHDYVAKSNLARLAPVVVRALGDARTRAAHLAAEERIRRLAYYDPITELPNRNLLFERVENLLRTPGQRLALMAVELLGVSEARKTLGALEADALLRIAARRFKQVLGSSGLVASLGSDRFAVVSPDAADLDAEEVAALLVGCLRTPLVGGHSCIRASAHVGIALAPAHGVAPEDLLRRAEIAAEHARRSDCSISVYSGEFDIYSEARLELINELWLAHERGELELLYQPKVDIQSRTVPCVEALLRWHRPGVGTVTPDVFMPLAEDFGSIRTVTAWVVGEALRQCASWRRVGLKLSVAVNLPASVFHDENLVNWLASELAKCGLPTAALQVELTEATLVRDPAAAARTLHGLRELGVYSAIDEFGTGYSSLAYLRGLPVRALKIDKGFVSGSRQDSRDASIVRSTIQLAHNLRLDVVAEGVEDAATLERLRVDGCDGAQGQFIAGPMSAKAVPSWVDGAPWQACG